MSEVHSVDFLLSLNTEQAEREVKKLEASLMRITRQIVRLSGQEDLRNMMELMQRAVVIAQSLAVAQASLQVAISGGMNPLAWANLIAAVGTTGITMYEAGVWMNETSSRSRGY